MKIKITKPYRYQVVGEKEFWEVEAWLILTIVFVLLVMSWILLGDGDETIYAFVSNVTNRVFGTAYD